MGIPWPPFEEVTACTFSLCSCFFKVDDLVHPCFEYCVPRASVIMILQGEKQV